MLARFLLALLIVSVAGARPEPLSSQDHRQSTPGRVLGCTREFCQEAAIYSTVLDTLTRRRSDCQKPAIAVLRTLHVSPLTYVGDNRRGLRRQNARIPSAPAVARIDDVVDPFSLWGDSVALVDAREVERGQADAGCLYVFAPVTWLREDYVRVVAVEWTQHAFAQFYVFLRRTDRSWTIVRIEEGAVS